MKLITYKARLHCACLKGVSVKVLGLFKFLHEKFSKQLTKRVTSVKIIFLGFKSNSAFVQAVLIFI